jgi:serine/threonine-protein kinase
MSENSELPEKLGKYKIEKVLGQGAMGIVYVGFDSGIERKAALKTVRKDVLDQGDAEEVLARFKREAQAAGRLLLDNWNSILDP